MTLYCLNGFIFIRGEEYKKICHDFLFLKVISVSQCFFKIKREMIRETFRMIRETFKTLFYS